MYNVASLIVTASVLLLLAFVALCLRFYVRLGLNHTKQGIWSDIRDHIGIDDWLILIAFVFVCGQCANQITCKRFLISFPPIKMNLYLWNQVDNPFLIKLQR